MIVDPGPLELHLPDGGHVIVAFANLDVRVGADGDELLETLLQVDGSEAEVARAISEAVECRGLTCTTSTDRHPTVVVVRNGS